MSRALAPVSRREMIQLIEDNIRTLERTLTLDHNQHPDNVRMLEIYRAISTRLIYTETPEYP